MNAANAQTWCQARHPETGDKCCYGGFHPKLPHTAKIAETRILKTTANGARFVEVHSTFQSWDHYGIIS